MKYQAMMRKWIVVSVLLLIGIILYQGWRWNLQWSVESGRERTLHSIFGFRVWTGSPEDTILSEWRGNEASDQNWRSVANGPGPGITEHCYPRIIQHFNGLDWAVRDSDDRSRYAIIVLGQIAARDDVCAVMRDCRAVGDAARKLCYEQDVEEHELSFEQLESLWENLRLSRR